MASPISDLEPLVLEHCAGCSETQANSAIRQTVVDFLKRTKIYAVDLDPISVVTGTASYALPNPAGWQIAHVRSATVNQLPLTPVSEEQLDLQWNDLQINMRNWRYDYSTGYTPASQQDWRYAASLVPELFYSPEPNLAVLVGKPLQDIADALRFKAVCFPLLTVTEIPDWIFATHYDTLRSGAVARLKMMKDKPYTDLRTAGDHDSAYEAGVAVAESAGLRSHKRNDRPLLRTRPIR